MSTTEIRTRRDWENLLGISLCNAHNNGGMVTVTPAIAKALRAKAPPYQRTIKPHHADSIAKDLTNGTFVNSGAAAIAFVAPHAAKANDPVTAYTIDGNHRCQAIVNTGVPTELFFRTIVADSEEEVQLIYAGWDQGKTRDLTAVHKAMSFESPLETRMAGIIKGASKWGILKLDPTAYSSNADSIRGRGQWVKDFTPEALQLQEWYLKLFGTDRDLYKLAKRAHVVALFLLVLRHGEAKHKAALSALQNQLERVSIDKMDPAKHGGLQGFIDAMDVNESDAPGRFGMIHMLIRAWECYLAGIDVPANVQDWAAPIKLSQPTIA